MPEIEKKKRRVKMVTKQKADIRALIKKNYLINLCPKCSDKKFTIISFNTQFTSINLQCNTCNKKTWEKLTHDFDKKDIEELKPLYKKFDSVNIYRRTENKTRSPLDKIALRLINISSNAHIIIKHKKSERHITQEVQDKVWNRDGGVCVQCGRNENLEFDHIIPVSKGGANTYRNIQLLCEPCNRSKSAKIG